MKDYLNEINDKFPIRRKKVQKDLFFDYVRSELGEEIVRVEVIDKNNNIIIGDPEKAKVVITAHYDTPAASVVPNMMLPTNRLLGMMVNMIYPVLLSIACIAIALIAVNLLGLHGEYAAVIYVFLYLGIFYSTTRLVANKHNKNDNTSGVATVMTLAKYSENDNVALILFDNEELGLLGSKAYNKAHKDMMKEKLLINLDCVGNGDQIIVMAKDKATQTEEYSKLYEAFSVDDEIFQIHHIPMKKASSNSDNKNFPASVGITASSRGILAKFLTGRIHTVRDTIADGENIDFLVERIGKFIDKI